MLPATHIYIILNKLQNKLDRYGSSWSKMMNAQYLHRYRNTMHLLRLMCLMFGGFNFNISIVINMNIFKRFRFMMMKIVFGNRSPSTQMRPGTLTPDTDSSSVELGTTDSIYAPIYCDACITYCGRFTGALNPNRRLHCCNRPEQIQK